MEMVKPFIKLCVIWHPGCEVGPSLAKLIFDCFRRDFLQNVSGGAGLPVMYRSEPGLEDGATLPSPIDLNDSAATAIIALVDRSLTANSEWVSWLSDLTARVESIGLSARVLPVAIDSSALQIGMKTQAIRWDKWGGMTEAARRTRLLSDITYQLCRMMRLYAEHLQRGGGGEEDLVRYLQKIEIFISHSKNDQYGQQVAHKIRDHLFQHGDFSTFFDVLDIPVGLQFDRVLLQKVKQSAVVAVHTDSYSSREWCKREIIEAKRWNVPLVIADSLNDLDERGFPYLGNVPVVRIEPSAPDRIDVVVFHLLGEVLKNVLWSCWTETVKKGAGADVVFVPRPPELMMLAGVSKASATLVYPEPPLGSEEEEIFAKVAPNVRLVSMVKWLAEIGV